LDKEPTQAEEEIGASELGRTVPLLPNCNTVISLGSKSFVERLIVLASGTAGTQQNATKASTRAIARQRIPEKTPTASTMYMKYVRSVIKVDATVAQLNFGT